MTVIVVDAELRSKLHNLTEPLQLCDADGRILARVVPVSDQGEWEQWEPAFDEADLARQESAGEKRYSLAEVLEHLRRAGNP